ncbi:MAG: dTMP kinase [Bacteroidota bacterium]
MEKKSRFIVIEGLDGSGKTTASTLLEQQLKKQYRVKRTYEPHNDMVAGGYIRAVLQKKIKRFSHRTLALSFAANRLDHRDRLIDPWLEKAGDRAIICDRYYLSSLVYQSQPDFGFKEVLKLNEKARKPDVIFFLNVSNEICYQRMQNRNQTKELFEENLEEDRQKFFRAIQYLRRWHGDTIVEIDASGTPAATVDQMMKYLMGEE